MDICLSLAGTMQCLMGQLFVYTISPRRADTQQYPSCPFVGKYMRFYLGRIRSSILLCLLVGYSGPVPINSLDPEVLICFIH